MLVNNAGTLLFTRALFTRAGLFRQSGVTTTTRKAFGDRLGTNRYARW